MTRLEAWLQRACEVVGLKVDFCFDVTCPDGQKIRSIARIRDVGALNGMLIIGSYEEVRKHLECLRVAGYGFAVLDEPGDNELFDPKSIREMFRDWGWVDNGGWPRSR